ncbi:MAG: N-acetyltransferase [Pseudomonadota bacterium]
MVVGPDTSRPVTPEEYDEVDMLLRAAFPSDAEARLVRQLRRDGDIWAEWVKPWSGRIAGYAALSRMAEPKGWACLGPVAVWPEWQNGRLLTSDDEAGRKHWRIGTRLVREIADTVTLPATVRDTPETIVVLGEVPFYERCGFSNARAARLRSPYPLSHTLIARPGTDVPDARLDYPGAFSRV